MAGGSEIGRALARCPGDADCGFLGCFSRSTEEALLGGVKVLTLTRLNGTNQIIGAQEWGSLLSSNGGRTEPKGLEVGTDLSSVEADNTLSYKATFNFNALSRRALGVKC